MNEGVPSSKNQFEQIKFYLDGVTLAAQRIGHGRKYKLIALHGWLDNSASFEFLLPYLNEFDCVAIDLAGHGESANRSGAGAYNIWQDVREIHEIVERLGWETFSLLGHSRGAMIASLYSASFPEQVKGLCLLDAVIPITAEAKALPCLLRESVLALKASSARPKSYFNTFDRAVLARTMGRFPLCVDAARALARRAVACDEEKGYFWRYDSRLLVTSEVRFTDEQALAFIDAFPCVAKLFVASEGTGPLQQQGIDRLGLTEHVKLSVEVVQGGHHLHFSSDKDQIINLAKLIHDYFLQHVHN